MEGTVSNIPRDNEPRALFIQVRQFTAEVVVFHRRPLTILSRHLVAEDERRFERNQMGEAKKIRLCSNVSKILISDYNLGVACS
jgi:hypothetical protein